MTKKEKHELRSSLGLKDDDFVMIFPARLDKNKNQGFLIKCMPNLIKQNPKIRLLLPGQDELNGKYLKIAKKTKVIKYVTFLNNRNDIPKLLDISDISVSSSKREGLPINIIEAFCAKKPVIAKRNRGVLDLIENEKNGYIIDKKADFITKTLLLLNNRNMRNKISQANSKKAAKYKTEIIMNKLIKIYGEGEGEGEGK